MLAVHAESPAAAWTARRHMVSVHSTGGPIRMVLPLPGTPFQCAPGMTRPNNKPGPCLLTSWRPHLRTLERQTQHTRPGCDGQQGCKSAPMTTVSAPMTNGSAPHHRGTTSMSRPCMLMQRLSCMHAAFAAPWRGRPPPPCPLPRSPPRIFPDACRGTSKTCHTARPRAAARRDDEPELTSYSGGWCGC